MQIDRINGLVGSIAIKVPCQAATTANITLSGAQTVDGVALVSNDRCLVKNQTTASENGIYDVSGTAWSRSLDFNGVRDIDQGTCVRIISGTVSGQYFYEVTTSSPLIGTTDIDFALVNFPVTTTSFMSTLLDDTTATEARTTLNAASLDSANTFTKTQKLAKGADIASSAALTLGSDGNSFDVSGTTAITSINTVGIGTHVTLQFDGILTLTHHATDLILPSAANITTAAGDIAVLYEYATGDFRCISYTVAAQSPVQYEEGTWTPTIQDPSLSDGEGQTYSFQTGNYTKIGNRVIFDGFVRLSSAGTLSGQLNIAGLPYTSPNVSNTSYAVAFTASGLVITAGDSLTGTIGSNSSHITIQYYTDAAGYINFQDTNLGVNPTFAVTGSYITA